MTLATTPPPLPPLPPPLWPTQVPHTRLCSGWPVEHRRKGRWSVPRRANSYPFLRLAVWVLVTVSLWNYRGSLVRLLLPFIQSPKLPPLPRTPPSNATLSAESRPPTLCRWVRPLVGRPVLEWTNPPRAPLSSSRRLWARLRVLPRSQIVLIPPKSLRPRETPLLRLVNAGVSPTERVASLLAALVLARPKNILFIWLRAGESPLRVITIPLKAGVLAPLTTVRTPVPRLLTFPRNVGLQRLNPTPLNGGMLPGARNLARNGPSLARAV